MKLIAIRKLGTLGIHPGEEYDLTRIYSMHQPMYSFLGSDYKRHCATRPELERYGVIEMDPENEIAESIMSSVIVESTMNVDPLLSSIMMMSKIILGWSSLTSEDISEIFRGRYLPLCVGFKDSDTLKCSDRCILNIDSDSKCKWDEALFLFYNDERISSLEALTEAYRQLNIKLLKEEKNGPTKHIHSTNNKSDQLRKSHIGGAGSI